MDFIQDNLLSIVIFFPLAASLLIFLMPDDAKKTIRWMALILSLVGGLIGILFGIGGAILFGQTSEMNTVIVPSSIGLAFGSAAAVGIFFGFFPANQAAQLDPIDALRHE